MNGEGRGTRDPQTWRLTVHGGGKEKGFSAPAAALDHSFLVPHSITTGWLSQNPPLSSHWNVRGGEYIGAGELLFLKKSKNFCLFFFGNLFTFHYQKTLTLDPMDAGGVGSGQQNVEDAAGFAWRGCGVFQCSFPTGSQCTERERIMVLPLLRNLS